MDQERLGAALVAALELALLAAHRLLGGLDGAAGRQPEAADLDQALALAGAAAAPHERLRALRALVGPPGAAGEPAPARVRPGDERASHVSRDAEPAPDHAETRGSGGEAAPCPAGLTRRELEVLRLIAAGQSNRQIAAALYLSPRTAERHVANIYLKIGAHSKAEATAYALRHRLA